MQTIRARLSKNYLLILGLGMTLAALLAWQAVSTLYINTQRDNLLAQARLIATALQGQPLPHNPQPYLQVANVLPGIHTRLLTDGGAVVVGLPLSDPNIQMPLAEQNASIPTTELLQRSEIKSALDGTPATALRRVLDNQRILYAAAPILADDGQITGIVYIATPLPEGGLPWETLVQLAVVVILSFFLASMTGRFVGQQITRPLEGLANAAKNIAAGDLKTRAPIEVNIQELHDLSQTFNLMAEDLNRSDQIKKAFIADVTHELRTPLTVIKGTIETLEDGALDDLEGRGSLLASMGRETERLIRLVNEMLVLARADAGALQLDLQPVDSVEHARSRCEVLAPLAAQRSVGLKVPGTARAIWADPDRLSQILDNLLDNAIRHSPPNSTITITINEKDDEIECAVSDQGPGIPPEHLPFIFERFYRVNLSRDRSHGGTGLGLAIVQALVRAQGGHISAESMLGRGTTIRFWLPAARNVTQS